MKLNKMWDGLKRIANGDYVLEGDLICEENLEIELNDRLVVKGKIEVKKNITAVKGIKAGLGINAGEGIKAGTFIHCEKRIFAGISEYHTNENCEKVIECAELQKGEICFGELVIKQKLKPCPFCRKSDSVAVYSAAEISKDPNELECYAVCCDIEKGGCGATGGYKDTPEEASENWNQRA